MGTSKTKDEFDSTAAVMKEIRFPLRTMIVSSGFAVGVSMSFAIRELVHARILVGFVFLALAIQAIATSYIVYMYFWKSARLSVLLRAKADRSAKASHAADVSHKTNRQLNSDARELYNSREWRTQAAAIKAIAEKVHRDPKTVERWIKNWRKKASDNHRAEQAP